MDKYLFNTMFDEEETKNEKDDKKDVLKQEQKLSVEDAPTFSEEDLNAAKQIALKQGIQEGKAEVMSGIEREIASSLDTISLKLESLMQVHKKWSEAMNKDTLRLAHAIMKKLAPQITRNGELNEVERTITHASPTFLSSSTTAPLPSFRSWLTCIVCLPRTADTWTGIS